MPSSPYARLPQLDRLLRHPDGQALLSRFSHSQVVPALRLALDDARHSIDAGDSPALEEEALLQAARTRLEAQSRPSLRRVINATGIVLHTNLGRSALAPAALQAVLDASEGYSTLEFDLATGERGSRHSHVSDLLCRLTGAEAAAVFNNNAAAVFLALATLAKGQEVVVSRGQLVEIGGSFRIPDILQSSGARLVEVGTTNRTRLDDYRKALTPETALLLKVHPSNYRVIGFEESVSASDLAALGQECGIPVMEDLGSGALADLSSRGIGGEPRVQDSIRAGLDLVAFSGDKLLGGPQAGLLLGRADLIRAIQKHPLARALRCDKMTLAALEATLRLYEAGREWSEIPTLRYLSRTAAEIRAMAEELQASLHESYRTEVTDGVSEAGGGSMPGEPLPTALLSLQLDGHSESQLLARLRENDPPIIGRAKAGRLLLDLRTVESHELPVIADALEALRANLL